MTLTTILCDTREQKGYDFEGYPVETDRVTLTTGDYTLAEFCEHDDDLDTYHPTLAVERKSAGDFLSSITADRKRFKNEIKRAEDWNEPLEVVVEEPWTTFTHNLNLMQYRDISPENVEATIQTWAEHYNVNFHFFADRVTAERFTYDTLMAWLRVLVNE